MISSRIYKNAKMNIEDHKEYFYQIWRKRKNVYKCIVYSLYWLNQFQDLQS